MIALLDPRLWLTFLLALALAFGAGYWQGARSANKAAELRETKANAEAATEMAKITENIREKESLMVRSLNAIAVNHQKKVNHEQQKMDSLRNDIRNGAVRLSIATGACHSSTTHPNPTATGRNRTEARTELMPADADALINIAADGDRAMQQVNACIDAYENVRLEINKVE